MLTLFPRIRANPIPPPPVPLEPPLEPKAAEPARENVPISMNTPPQRASVVEIEEKSDCAGESLAANDAISGDAATSVSDADVFSAFLSGLATGNSEPFIVEITAQPAGSEAQEKLEPSITAKCVPEIAEPDDRPFSSPDEAGARAALPDVMVAPVQNPEPNYEAVAAQHNSSDASPNLIVADANIFDELDVLHEAAIASSLPDDNAPRASECASDLNSVAESRSDTPDGAAVEAVRQTKIEGEPNTSAPIAMAELEARAPVQPPASEPPATIPHVATRVEYLPHEQAPVLAPVQSAIEELAIENNSNESAIPQIAAGESSADTTQTKADETHAVEQPLAEAYKSPGSAVTTVTASNSKPLEKVDAKPPTHSTSSRPPKPRRAKGTFFGLARVPEPETMDDSGEVEAYASAAGQAHLDAIDDTFVAHAQLLLKGRERGRVLDIGTGPGQIVIKLGYRLTRWKFVGIDRSATMIEKALESLATAGELAGRVDFRIADGNALDFPDKSFEMVVCNSVLHHIPEPGKLFSEIARVVKPGGAILLRDLRRPSRPGYTFHVWKNGKHYSGEMRRLFIASVQAAYTEEELQKMLATSPLRDARVFRHGKTHIGFERALAGAVPTNR